MITLRINGTERAVAAETVSALVAEIGLPAETLLVEHNGIALHRSEWPERQLAANDQIEILRVAAGG